MKRITALFLVILLLGSLLISCSDADEGNPTADPAATTAAVEDANANAPSGETKLEPNLPAADFGGETINFLVRSEEYHWYWCSKEIYAEEENGDQLNDAVYKRNRHIEDKYNFNIAETRVANPNDTAQKTIKSGEKIYDVMMLGLKEGASFAQSGMLVDLHTVPNLDLKQPWWDQRGVRDLSIGNKLFFALGDLNVMDNDATQAIVFNKKLVIDYQLESPYDLVRNNGWTIDKYYEMIRKVSTDVNADGKFDGEDILGHLSDAGKTNALFVGAGGRITTKDANDYPVLAMNDERTIGIVEKVVEIMIDSKNTLLATDYTTQYNNPWDDFTRPMFINNQGLFYLVGMGTVQLMRNMDADFGLMPMPKFNAEQAEYYNVIEAPSTNAVMIPSTNERLEFTGHVLEAMAAESMYTLTPAYYDVNFMVKAIRDEDSIEMLKIILETRAYDIGNVYDWAFVSSILYDMVNTKKTDYVSMYEQRERRALVEMERTFEAYRQMG